MELLYKQQISLKIYYALTLLMKHAFEEQLQSITGIPMSVYMLRPIFQEYKQVNKNLHN